MSKSVHQNEDLKTLDADSKIEIEVDPIKKAEVALQELLSSSQNPEQNKKIEEILKQIETLQNSPANDNETIKLTPDEAKGFITYFEKAYEKAKEKTSFITDDPWIQATWNVVAKACKLVYTVIKSAWDNFMAVSEFGVALGEFAKQTGIKIKLGIDISKKAFKKGKEFVGKSVDAVGTGIKSVAKAGESFAERVKNVIPNSSQKNK